MPLRTACFGIPDRSNLEASASNVASSSSTDYILDRKLYRPDPEVGYASETTIRRFVKLSQLAVGAPGPKI